MKMTTKKTTNNEEKTTVADRLPELTEEELGTAQENVGWAAGFIGVEQGTIHHDVKGISLQVISNRTVRCLSVGDHPYCYRTLAYMARSFELAGVEFQVGSCTIPRPAPPEGPEKPPTTEPGLEVA